MPHARTLRGWQRKALRRYLTHRTDDFMIVATPGAGKTTFALTAAAELIANGVIEQLISSRRPII